MRESKKYLIKQSLKLTNTKKSEITHRKHLHLGPRNNIGELFDTLCIQVACTSLLPPDYSLEQTSPQNNISS